MAFSYLQTTLLIWVSLICLHPLDHPRGRKSSFFFFGFVWWYSVLEGDSTRPISPTLWLPVKRQGGVTGPVLGVHFHASILRTPCCPFPKYFLTGLTLTLPFCIKICAKKLLHGGGMACWRGKSGKSAKITFSITCFFSWMDKHYLTLVRLYWWYYCNKKWWDLVV